MEDRGERDWVERCGWSCKWKTEGSEIGRGAVWMGGVWTGERGVKYKVG